MLLAVLVVSADAVLLEVTLIITGAVAAAAAVPVLRLGLKQQYRTVA